MGRICLVRHYYYPEDPRGRREAEALAMAGHEVEVISLRRKGEAAHDEVAGVHIRRLPVDHRRGSILRYCYEYGLFFFLAFCTLTWRHLRRRYDTVQVNTMPDFLVYSALIPKLFGARIVLDMHESVPELYRTKYRVPATHPMVRLLGWVEQRSTALADQVIVCTEQQKEVCVARGTRPDKVAVVLNGAHTSIFRPRRTEPLLWRAGETLRLVTHGLIVERYGHDTMVRAVAEIGDRIPVSLDIYGHGTFVEGLRTLVVELGVEDRVRFHGFVAQDELLAAIDGAHIGLVATKKDPFWDTAHTQKMYEYIAMRKPVVIGETRAVRAYFDDQCFRFFASDDPVALATVLEEFYHHPEWVAPMIEQSVRRSRGYAWEVQQQYYREAVLGPQPSLVGGAATLAEDKMLAPGALARTREVQIAQVGATSEGTLAVHMLGTAEEEEVAK